MERKLICLLMMLVVSLGLHAQSVSYAQSLINQGRYLDAAKQLRPLADGGNAEAQLLAAQLFFEGKGVAKNNAQGVKYASLAADQGNEDAMLLLVGHYEKSNPSKVYELANKYVDRHPYLKKERIGCVLSVCYLGGFGVPVNEKRGWEIMEQNNHFEQWLGQDKQRFKIYLDYKVRQAGKSSIDEYADYLYSTNRSAYQKTLGYMDKCGLLTLSSLEQRANEGKGWAMAKLAEHNDANGRSYLAKSWAQKAADAGSQLGRNLSDKYNYVSQSYTNITTASRPRNFAIGQVTRNYETTVVDVVYNNPITLSPNIYLTCNGKSYRLVNSSNDLNRRIIVSNRKTYTVILTFEAIPESTNTFTMIEPNGDTWRDVTFR